MFYVELFKELQSRKVQYLIAGGLAVNLHQAPRMTFDIDLVIAMDRENIMNFLQAMKNLGYFPQLPVNPELLCDPVVVNQWMNDKNMKAFSFIHEKDLYKVVDVVLTHPLDFPKSFSRKMIRHIDDTDLFVVSIEDLIRMKQFSGRERDFNDVSLLEKVKRLIGHGSE